MDPDKLRQEARVIEAEAEKPEFWKDNQNAAAKMRQLAALQDLIKKLEILKEDSIVSLQNDEPGRQPTFARHSRASDSFFWHKTSILWRLLAAFGKDRMLPEKTD